MPEPTPHGVMHWCLPLMILPCLRMHAVAEAAICSMRTSDAL